MSNEAIITYRHDPHGGWTFRRPIGRCFGECQLLIEERTQRECPGIFMGHLFVRLVTPATAALPTKGISEEWAVV